MLIAFAALIAGGAQAAADHFDYDPLGRLIRRVDDAGRVTEYRYDASGNILAVTSGGTIAPPSVSGISPASASRNKVVPVTVTGTGLVGVSVSSDDPEIVAAGVVATTAGVTFRLSVSPRATLGAHTLTFRNSLGAATASFDVLPALAYELVPSPIQLAPDGISRKVTLRLGHAVSEATTVAITSAAPAVAKPSVGQLVLQPGQTEAAFGVIGVANGTTVLRLRLPDSAEPLEPFVFVDAGFSSGLLAKGAAVGVTKGVPWALSPSTQVVSGPIGVTRSVPWAVSPNALVSSGMIGITKGVPWSTAPNAGPLIAPLVGIDKP